MSKTPYRHFDLPTKHLTSLEHFIPPKARDEDEIERRRALPRGTLLAEYQYRGLAMSSMIINLVREKPDISFVVDALAPAGLNTAWYSFGRGASVMRRQLQLPKLDADEPEQRPSSYILQADGAYFMRNAAEENLHLIDAIKSSSPTVELYHKHIARGAGHAALLLSCIAIGDSIGYEMPEVSNFELQVLARQQGLKVLERSRSLEGKIGLPPSIAQLSDPDSCLSVYWRRNAPNEARTAYQQSYETMAMDVTY